MPSIQKGIGKVIGFQKFTYYIDITEFFDSKGFQEKYCCQCVYKSFFNLHVKNTYCAKVYTSQHVV